MGIKTVAQKLIPQINTLLGEKKVNSTEIYFINPQKPCCIYSVLEVIINFVFIPFGF
jgi:acyl-CoA thioesterase